MPQASTLGNAGRVKDSVVHYPPSAVSWIKSTFPLSTEMLQLFADGSPTAVDMLHEERKTDDWEELIIDSVNTGRVDRLFAIASEQKRLKAVLAECQQAVRDSRNPI